MPNVSYCVNENEVHYNPYIDPCESEKVDTTYEWVEIGGTKWATKNIGALAVTDYGQYFAWGETDGYTSSQVYERCKLFSWNDYKYGSGFTKYNSTDGKTVLEPSDDAATVNMGTDWRMPTKDEYVALGNAVNTAWTEDYQGSGVAGMICTDKNDSSKVLFFPACGYCYDGSVSIVGSYGDYWSSSLDSSRIHSAYYSYFRNGYVNWQDYRNRCYGFPVRGVVG